MNVLIVDDSKSMRQMIDVTLSSAGFNVTQANDGHEGLSFSKSKKYDIIITDINMPNMGGYEMVENIRKDSLNISTPILCLTTESSTDAKTKGKSVGATGWIVKPFTPEKLIEVINRVV